SLFLTLVVVGLPTWLAHWRPAPPDAERRALSRRLYLFAALLGSVLTLLGSGAYAIQRLLALLLGASTIPPWTDVEHAASLSVVALAVALYHWRVLRADGEQRATEIVETPTALPPGRLVVEIVGATEADVTAALTALPPSARYAFLDAPPL